jgi:acetolactate synthase-1/2/3 large subunit
MSNKGGIVQFEVSPKNINKVVPVDISIEACLSRSLPHFLSLIEQRSSSSWNDQVSLWKAKYPFGYMPSKENGKMKPQYVIEELNTQTAHMKKNVIISTGVGCHQMFAVLLFVIVY